MDKVISYLFYNILLPGLFGVIMIIIIFGSCYWVSIGNFEPNEYYYSEANRRIAILFLFIGFISGIVAKSKVEYEDERFRRSKKWPKA